MSLKYALTVILTASWGICGWTQGLCASRTPQSPVDVVTTYLQAWINKDWRSMYDLLDASTKEDLTLQQFRETFVLRVPVCEEDSYFVPARYAEVALLREDGDTAWVGYILAFTKEGYMGKRLAQITNEEYRKTTSNADRYLMRLQAAMLLADVHNLRSLYVDVAWHVYVGEYLQKLPVFEIFAPSDMKGFYYYVSAKSDDTVGPKRADNGAYYIITHLGSPRAISTGAMMLRRTGDRWFITNAVVPLTDSMRSSRRWISDGIGGSGMEEAFKFLAQRLGLLD